MSQDHKPNSESQLRFPFPPSQPPTVNPKEREQVTRLIASGKTRNAVDLSKQIHHRRQSADSEALLVDAYRARFQTLVDRKMEYEARQLMEMVAATYPSARDRLPEWSALLAARQGNLDALIAPLNDPALPSDRQAAIAAEIRRHADLHALAECPALAADHPLRVAAAALWNAFNAVTTGPVAEEALSLLEVSRHSPLAPWKMLVRAIAAYYRHEDALCEKLLAAVGADSAAARLVPALGSMIRQKHTLTPASIDLVKQAGGGVENLRVALIALDAAFAQKKQSQTPAAIRNAVTVCSQVEPALLERLKQHISVRAMLAGIDPKNVTQALEGGSLKNAYFWRLLARGTEEEKGNSIGIPLACSLWEEFRKHAIHEGWFPDQGPEVAAIYLHIDDLWHRLSPDSVAHLRNAFISEFRGHAEYYRGQPPEIRALMPKPGEPDLFFLSPFSTLERACQADPCSENFQRWLRSADRASKLSDTVAERWYKALPRDIPPLLHLMESAEKRNALKKAFKYMETAEQIDGLNSEVRRARLRLLVSMAVRHLKDRKAHLAEDELSQLEALPAAQQGDRPAFIAALRWIWGQVGGPSNVVLDAQDALIRLLESDLAAQVVLDAVCRECGFVGIDPPAPPKGVQVSGAIGRACALANDMGVPCVIPEKLFNRIEKELSAKEFTAPVPALMALGEAAILQGLDKMGYAIAGAGLAQGVEGQARFLYLRARGMPPWEDERRASCLAAASELARRQRDTDLLNRIGEFRDEEMDWLDGPPDAKSTNISAEEIAGVVEREARDRGYPKSQPYRRQSGSGCQCPACQAERGELAVPRELVDMMDSFGPDAVAQALAEIIGLGGLGPGGRKRRKRRATFLGDDDTPF